MQLVIDPKNNVWVDNPHLLAIPVFADFEEEFGNQHSSDIMTCIYYIHDARSPLKDTYKNAKEIEKDVNQTILKDPKFKWSSVKHVVEAYEKHVPSKASVELERFRKEVQGLNDFLKGWAWSEESVKDKVRALADSEKLWGIYLKLKEQVDAENQSTGSHGGYRKSKLEKYRTKS